MTPEERSLLERTAALAQENNTMLRSIRRSGRISLALRIAYWVLIILVSFGAYYFIQPYVESFTSYLTADGNKSATSTPGFIERYNSARSLLQ